MEHGCMKQGGNVYFSCRKEAAKYDDRLSSRENAAELLGISASTLANHELGVTKNVPVDTVVMMADLYRAPKLKNMYCKYECPIGRDLPIATDDDSIEAITVRLLNRLDDEEIRTIKHQLLDVAEDGSITSEERPIVFGILKALEKVSETVSSLKLLVEGYSD